MVNRTRQPGAPAWRTVTVDGARVEVMEAGTGDPLLFLHGWGMTPRAYADSVVRLCQGGVRVIAPSLPGFGGSSPLGLRAGLGRYAERIGRLVDVLEVEKPSFVAGHSFGGGVAIELATRRPDLVRSLTLLNAVGGAPGRDGMSQHSWVRWAVGALGELDPRDLPSPRASLAVLRDVVPNVARHPLHAATTAALALTASLAAEATQLVESGLPVLFVWGDRDRLIAPGSLASVTGVLGNEIVEGRHGWMLTKPEEFAETIRGALVCHAMLERQRRGQAIYLPHGEPLSSLFPPERRHRNRPPSQGSGRSGVQ